MRPWRASTPVKFPVGLKFAGAVGAVAVGVLTVAVTAGIGLGQLQSDVERLISDDLGRRLTEQLRTAREWFAGSCWRR